MSINLNVIDILQNIYHIAKYCAHDDHRIPRII